MLLSLLTAMAISSPALEAVPTPTVAEPLTNDLWMKPSSPPKLVGKIGALFDQTPFPVEAKGRAIIIGYRMLVSASGQPEECDVTERPVDRVAVLEELTCQNMMTRAKFAPARAPNGKPMPAYFESRHLWLDPAEKIETVPIVTTPIYEPPTPLFGSFTDIINHGDYPAAAIRAEAEGSVRFQLTIDTEGLVTGCSILESSGSEVLDERTCKIMMERAEFFPPNNAEGRRRIGQVTYRFTWRLG